MAEEGAIADAERGILQWLCRFGADSAGPSPTKNLRLETIACLRSYRFQIIAHQVLFDCIWELRVLPIEALRRELPVRLVRAGFPDFDLRPYFEPTEMGAAELAVLLRRLFPPNDGRPV